MEGVVGVVRDDTSSDKDMIGDFLDYFRKLGSRVSLGLLVKT